MLFLSTYCNVFFCRGTEDALLKNQRRAQRLLEEIHAMKVRTCAAVCMRMFLSLLSVCILCVCWVTYFNIIEGWLRLILWVCLVKNVAHLENCNMLKLAFSFSLNLLKYLTNLRQNIAKLNSSVFSNASCLRFLFLL